jgi:hypothetical protein
MLIGSNDEAVERVMALRADSATELRLGSAARRDAVALNTEDLPRRTIALLTDRRSTADRAVEAEAVTV